MVPGTAGVLLVSMLIEGLPNSPRLCCNPPRQGVTVIWGIHHPYCISTCVKPAGQRICSPFVLPMIIAVHVDPGEMPLICPGIDIIERYTVYRKIGPVRNR